MARFFIFGACVAAALGAFWFFSDSDAEVVNQEQGTLLVASGDRLFSTESYAGYASGRAVVKRLDSGCIGLGHKSGRETAVLWPAGTELSGDTISFRGRELRLGDRLPEEVGLLEGDRVADLDWTAGKVGAACSKLDVEIIVVEPK